MALASNLGFPRIGPRRELKRAVERYWKGKISADELHAAARAIRRDNWTWQKQAGIEHIPCNDFSLYDHVLDTAALVGAVPSRYQAGDGTISLDTYFAMARGRQDVPAMEMTKWFDTNYHYIVPEFANGQTFRPASTKPLDEFREAKELGIHTRPVLLGPVSFLLLGKAESEDLDPLALLDDLLPVYEQVLRELAAAGADWIQLDEPCLVLDLNAAQKPAFEAAYRRLANVSDRLKLLVATYFGDLRDNLATAVALPVAALHVDFVRGADPLDDILQKLPQEMSLSLGVVDGRNIWKNDLERSLKVVRRAVDALGSERVIVGPSCSLLHGPVDIEVETGLDEELRGWLAFARQKLAEIVTLTRAVNEGEGAVETELAANRAVMASRRTSPRIHNQAVKDRAAAVTGEMLARQSGHAERRDQQARHIKLPLLPTTTIGSFPQTRDVRKARASARAGTMSAQEYERFLRAETEQAVRIQEEIGLDVLVHGEFERNDMVEYFGEHLSGFTPTSNGWVQSYGSRCVKPPIIYGDLQRTAPMTVDWWQYAQSLSKKPVKGMLTGPVTILQWSFVRDDQSRAETCRQIALAMRDEVSDLEAAGCKIIQIDEPAIREGLPLRRKDWDAYLKWAVDCFRLTSSGVRDETQIHTHMCYAEFNDIIKSIGAMDADVISIEATRSKMELLDAFVAYQYPNQIGPGVYDIHSPRVPSASEVSELLGKALAVLSPHQLWVNPDCGLKTRGWDEVKQSLTNMVAAAKEQRARVGVESPAD